MAVMNKQTFQTFEQAAKGSNADARIALANRLMAGYMPGTEQHERGLEMLHEAADAADGAQARWLLGAYYLQVSSRSQAHAQALRWLRLAAADGIAPAMDRLADLYLSGLVAETSDSEALSLQLRLADQGYQRAAWEAAYLLDELGPLGQLDAGSMFLRACALGYPPAYYSLGLRFAAGSGVPSDVAFGWALLRRAADGGYAGAAEAAQELVRKGFDDQGWYEKLKSNLHAAHPTISRLVPGDVRTGETHPMIPRLERHLVSIGHPSLRLDGQGRAQVFSDTGSTRIEASRAWTWLSRQPRIAVCRGFATREECMHLINKVAAALKPASEYRRGNSANEDAELESFNGRGHPIGALHTDSVTRMLERRVAAMTQWPIRNLEPCSIICYRTGEEYKPHVDFFSDEQIVANERIRRDFGGQRIATFLLYLKAPEAGGETSYLEAGVDVVGEEGMSVIHYNVTASGRQDRASIHSGTPIVSGEKWLWRSTLRQHSLYGREGSKA